MTSEVLKYDFTETSGLILSDSSGNNRDAILNELQFIDTTWQAVVVTDSNKPNWDTPVGGGPFAPETVIKAHQFVSGEKLYFLYGSSILSQGSDFSFSYWMYPTQDMSSYQAIFATSTDNTSTGDFQISVKPTGSTNEIYMHSDSSYSHIIGIVTTDVWNHIVVTYKHNSGTNATLKTYLNGSNQYNYTNTQVAPVAAGYKFDVVKVGVNRNEDDGGQFFVGYLSAFSFYDGELTQTEIDDLYSDNEICYHESTFVLTKNGYKSIKDLKRGDLIKTFHNNYQPLSKLIKSINVSQEFILFPKNSICDNVPNQDFMITRGHPIYYKDDYYLSENFINDKIKIIKDKSPYMYHLVFDTHEVINTNNLTTTSLPNITNYNNMYLRENEYIDKSKYKKDNIGKHYPPYMLHEDPLMIKTISF